MKYRFIVILVVLIVALATIVIMKQDSFRKQAQLEGYVIWLSEGVVLVENVEFTDNGYLTFLSEPIWVEQNEKEKELLKQASNLRADTKEESAITITYTYATILGILEKHGNYGHLGKYNSQVRITEIIEVSNYLPN